MSLTSTSRASVVVGAFLVSAFSILTAGCEDKAIGRSCDVQADAGALQAVYNGQALECPSRICLKPAREVSVAMQVDTVPYCTAECSKDSDCEGEDRNAKNTADKRCTSGFVCGVAFEVGPLCCKKLCLCKDFIKSGIKTPASCMESRNPTSTCQNL